MPARALPVEPAITNICDRQLSDADCDVRCCACCHNEDKLDGFPVGPACLEEFAEMQRDLAEDR